MKLLIIGPQQSKDNKLLVKAARKRKHEVKLVPISKLLFTVKNSQFKISYGSIDLKDYDKCLFRGISPYFAKAKTTAKYLHKAGLVVIDRELYSKVYEFDKLFMYEQLYEDNIPTIDSFYFPNVKLYNANKKRLVFPLIIKHIRGMHGRNIFWFEKISEVEEFFSKKQNKISNYLFQKLIDSDSYLRVFVIGRKSLGAMQRMTLVYQQEHQVQRECRSFPGTMTKEIKKLAVKAALATNTDIAGVDLIIDEQGTPLIFEVNRTPQFSRFTQVMSIDVATEIVRYMEKAK